MRRLIWLTTAAAAPSRCDEETAFTLRCQRKKWPAGAAGNIESGVCAGPGHTRLSRTIEWLSSLQVWTSPTRNAT